MWLMVPLSQISLSEVSSLWVIIGSSHRVDGERSEGVCSSSSGGLRGWWTNGGEKIERTVRQTFGNHTMGNEFRCLLVTDATLNEYLLLTGIFNGHRSVNESLLWHWFSVFTTWVIYFWREKSNHGDTWDGESYVVMLPLISAIRRAMSKSMGAWESAWPSSQGRTSKEGDRQQAGGFPKPCHSTALTMLHK